ncbi:hypothetical protein DAPPUDRAFT_310553 [Daphnia pulex]|uniref:Uncharacterized protein n=1 Tax=Daphnia pulex TaxID=6669 RepID=E9FU02_DAPPU|nr:hypothetical protein DAPPUDRAFT_310553 [Daphnia pulex]|eukprot:EFX89457.1 hypothetical protein DAPPUDRAFT_310553 [Daphnia pulex]
MRTSQLGSMESREVQELYCYCDLLVFDDNRHTPCCFSGLRPEPAIITTSLCAIFSWAGVNLSSATISGSLPGTCMNAVNSM